MEKKTLRKVQPAHRSPNITPRQAREAWLKTYAAEEAKSGKNGGASRAGNPSKTSPSSRPNK